MDETIAQFVTEESTKDELIIPQRLNQQHQFEEFKIDTCREDQKEANAYVLQFVKRWDELDKTPEALKTFTPLRMTLCGVAGSGKSTLINTLVTAVRKITGRTNSVHVVAPTGSAAFNAGGETCHQLFHIKGKIEESNLSGSGLKTLMEKLEDTVVLIVDERSMLSGLLLGTMEAYCRQAMFQGQNNLSSWGGLPIVILVGDDYQLPSIDVGAFYCFGDRPRKLRTKVEEEFVQNGMVLFQEFGKDVMTLVQSKRVLQG